MGNNTGKRQNSVSCFNTATPNKKLQSDDRKAQIAEKKLGHNYRITDKYVFFMEGFLHQWYKSEMIIDDQRYISCEQYMMVQKAALFNDSQSLEKLFKSQNPLDQKVIGRQIKNFDQETWNQHRFDIVYKGNLEKFKQNKKLRDKLLSYPHSVTFVNANPGDKIWGIGVGVFDSNCIDPNNWNGLNLLGKVVTNVRDKLINTDDNRSPITNKQEKLLFVIAGYIRTYIEQKYQIIIPEVIILLISQFFNVLEPVRFTVFNKKNCMTDNNGFICKTSANPEKKSCHRLFIGDKAYGDGVVVWKIKYHNLFCRGICGVVGGIGIISQYDANIVLHSRPWLQNSCFTDKIYLEGGAIINDQKHNHKTTSLHHDQPYKNGDVVSVELNCNEWYVRFYVNDHLLWDKDKNIDKVRLNHKKKYYPYLAFFYEGDQYEVVVE